MGWVGCYQLHVYCDYCGRFDDCSEPGVDRATEHRRLMREGGYMLLRDGTTKCPACVKNKISAVVPHREGSNWQLFK